ncbi:hypothetical protein Pmar_PMAR024844, partial [Perkinsus marinus ATCC 50983]
IGGLGDAASEVPDVPDKEQLLEAEQNVERFVTHSKGRRLKLMLRKYGENDIVLANGTINSK